MGFSVNVPRAESQFAPLEKQDLDTIFGKDNYKLAEDVQTLEKIVTLGRYGIRDLSLADVPDLDRGDTREFSGQYILQGSPQGERPKDEG